MVTATEPSIQEQGFKARSSLEITLSVWRALFLREALSRLSATRSAPLWLFFEPVFHVSYMLFLFTVIRMRVMGGLDTVIWLLAGVLPFILFRRTATQAGNAVGANQALFTFRQVKPIDTVLVRAMLELLILLLVAAILFGGTGLLGYDIFPADPLTVIIAGAGLWLLGLGWGLITSVAKELIPESGNVANMLMVPLYIMSGTVFPISSIPYPYRDWLMLNPIVHGLEAIRHGFSPYYHAPTGVDVVYLLFCALCMVFIGLALHRHFSLRLVTQ